MTTKSVVQQVADLRALEERVRGRRAQAEANLSLAKTQLEQTEKELRGLGIDPDMAEQELATLEAQLAQAATTLESQLQAELASCEEVMRVTSEALR